MNAVTQIYEPEAPAFEANRPSMGKVFRRTGWRHVVAWIALLFALFPVAWVISAAFSDGNRSTSRYIVSWRKPRPLGEPRAGLEEFRLTPSDFPRPGDAAVNSHASGARRCRKAR